tara:strand:+ start:2657 stop:4111 length:1455 start_codon:yes stop_codon:yes gene_type:complete
MTLESDVHYHIKNSFQSYIDSWPNLLTLSRLLAKALRKKEISLFSSYEFRDLSFSPALIIPIILNNFKALLITNKSQKSYLENFFKEILESKYFSECLDNIDMQQRIRNIKIISTHELVSGLNINSNIFDLIIFTSAEDIIEELRIASTYKIISDDWDSLIKINPSKEKLIERTYDIINQNIFYESLDKKNQILFNKESFSLIRNLAYLNTDNNHCKIWSEIKNLYLDDWLLWTNKLYMNNFTELFISPIDPFKQFRRLFIDRNIIFMINDPNNDYLINELRSNNLSINLNIKLIDNKNKSFNLFFPRKTLLPNTAKFVDNICYQCDRLVMFRNGWTLILCDDVSILNKIFSYLKLKFDTKVIYESLPHSQTSIVCSSYRWWLNVSSNSYFPEQIIIALLPIPSIDIPVIKKKVEYLKLQSKDWFRSYLLPKATLDLSRSIFSLRHNSGRLVILDGRIKSRKWARILLQKIKPWKMIKYVLPFD